LGKRVLEFRELRSDASRFRRGRLKKGYGNRIGKKMGTQQLKKAR